jgi:hypothetical protein
VISAFKAALPSRIADKRPTRAMDCDMGQDGFNEKVGADECPIHIYIKGFSFDEILNLSDLCARSPKYNSLLTFE